MTFLDEIKNEIDGKTVFFELIKDDNNVHGLSLSFENKEELEHYYILTDNIDVLIKDLIDDNEKVCWNARSLRKFFKKECDITDISFFYSQDSLIRAAGSNLTDSEVDLLNQSKRKIESHVRACRIAKINLKEYPLHEVMPKKILVDFYKMKNFALHALWKKIDKERIEVFRNQMFQKMKTFYEIETYGIAVDPKIEFEDTTGNRRFISDIDKRTKTNGKNIVYTGFNLTHATRTGRVHPIKNSFGCMNIPNSSVRKAIVSKFKKGSIASIDMNAADYRCIVSMIDNDFINSTYKDCEDFHDKTVEYIFGIGNSNPLRRKVIKNITYTAIYGGSVDKLSAQTGLSHEKILAVLKKMEKISNPINKFSDELYEKSIRNGFVNDMLGNKIELKGDEHRGQVLALFAQSCCSKVFMDGVNNLHEFLIDYDSHIIFTVHDEVVIDINEKDIGLVEKMKDSIEDGASRALGSKLKATIKIGKNYWEMK